MPQEQPGQTQQPQQIGPVPQDQQIKLAQKIIQSRLPQPVQIGAKKKIPNWLLILIGTLVVLAIIIVGLALVIAAS